jgi:hypothetical protein
MLSDPTAWEVVERLREEDEASAFNLAEQIVAGDPERAVLALLQLAAAVARLDPAGP